MSVFSGKAFYSRAFSAPDEVGFSSLAFSRRAFDTAAAKNAFSSLAFSRLAFDTEGPAATGVSFSPSVFSTLAFSATPRVVTDATITIYGVLPTLAGRSKLALGIVLRTVAALPALSGFSSILYRTDTARPLVGQCRTRWQDGVADRSATAMRWQDSTVMHTHTSAEFQEAERLQAGFRAQWNDADRSQRPDVDVRFERGVPLQARAEAPFQDALRGARNFNAVRFQRGVRLERGYLTPFQDGIRTPNRQRVRWQDADPLATYLQSIMQTAVPLQRGWSTRYQEGIPPRPGRTDFTPPEPPEDTCYTPNPNLVFSALWVGSADLLFVCDTTGPGPEPGATVVVPVRRIYTVINSAMLRRVDGNVLIPNASMSLTIDVDSWTWGFSARVPGAALPDLEPAGGESVEVEATINGIAYRAIVEGIGRERIFGRSDLTITGRGKSAVLDSPYSAFLTFGNPTNDRTVQQLANDVLSLNGVSLGWDVDAGWKPDDWLVPAGAWSFQGSRMAALNAIAAAAGAYVQPHRTDKALSMLRRYPAKPWEWDDVTPDFELPSDVVQKEGVTWSDKALYNRVFVRGMKSGILGQATRLGTAGDLEAPMVTDQLITNAIGARQRALPVLADVGRQAAVSLRLPVLAETGIIPPGKFVRYVDAGVTRIGLVRSVSAEVQRADKKLTIWQTIGVETHVSV